jgi:hypothetical protein
MKDGLQFMVDLENGKAMLLACLLWIFFEALRSFVKRADLIYMVCSFRQLRNLLS